MRSRGGEGHAKLSRENEGLTVAPMSTLWPSSFLTYQRSEYGYLARCSQQCYMTRGVADGHNSCFIGGNIADEIL